MTLNVSSLGIDGLQDVEQIGTGGSSRVYRARQVDLDREIAVKVINSGEDPDVARRFDRERKAMGRLSQHEGIVPVYSSGVTANGEPYLVMPFYANGSLQDRIDSGPLGWQEAVRYVQVSAETIAAAHQEGVVHLDLKPANILLTQANQPRIADFGIAKLTSSNATARTTGTAFTPAYSAPETFLDGITSPASDVYGLGATLWALLVGYPPFLAPGDDNNLMAVIGRVVNNPVGDLRHLCPAPICDVIERAMAKRPEQRFHTARQFSDALMQASAAAGGPQPADERREPTGLFPDPVSSIPAAATTVSAPPAPQTTGLDPGALLAPGPSISSARIIGTEPTEAFASVGSDLFPEAAAPPPNGGRRLLQESASPMARPAAALPPREPVVDLDRFRLVPFFAISAMVALIALLSIFALTRGDANENESVAAEDTAVAPTDLATTDPANPSITVDGSGQTASDFGSDSSSNGEDAVTSTSEVGSVTTTGSSVPTSASTSSTTDSSTSSTASTTSVSTSTPTTADTTSTTEATTTTTEATTTTTEATTTTTEATTTTTTIGRVRTPVNLAAVVDNGEVALTWERPTNGPRPTGFKIYRNNVVLTTVSNTAYTDANVVAGMTYTYEVTAVVRGGNESDPSPSRTVELPIDEPLDVSSSLVTTTDDSITIKLTVNACVSYRIGWTNLTTTEQNAFNSSGGCVSEAERTITGLDADTTYAITVTVSAGDEQAAANTLSVTTLE